MTPQTSYYKDPDARLLVTELAVAVQDEMKRRRLYARRAARQMPVGLATLYGLLSGKNVSLDTFFALARWAGYQVTLTPRGEP